MARCNELDVIASGGVATGAGLFSDESRFALSHADGRTWVYRRINELCADCCVLERDQFGRGSLMVLGGIMGGQKTDLVVMQGSLNSRRSCVLMTYHFTITRVPVLLSNMAMQDFTLH